MPSLVSLVYCSRMSVALHERDGPGERNAVADILAASRRNNAARGITGALLCGAGYFAQVLEGECDLVGATMAAIEADDRHEQVNILQVRLVPQRDFKGWTMANATVRATEGPTLDGTLTAALLARAHAGEASMVGALYGLLRTGAVADPSWAGPAWPLAAAIVPAMAVVAPCVA